jgi:hypothetical protein
MISLKIKKSFLILASFLALFFAGLSFYSFHEKLYPLFIFSFLTTLLIAVASYIYAVEAFVQNGKITIKRFFSKKIIVSDYSIDNIIVIKSINKEKAKFLRSRAIIFLPSIKTYLLFKLSERLFIKVENKKIELYGFTNHNISELQKILNQTIN